MTRYPVIALLIAMALVDPLPAQDAECPVLLKDERDLDRLYQDSELVFIASIEPRNSLNTQIYNFHLFEPVLKGDVPKSGHVTFARHCQPLTDRAIYLFLLNSLEEEIEGYNAIFFSLPDEGPGFTWIADWVEDRISRGE